MLNLVQAETERIDSRFLEPACGSGNFLVPILRRKLAAVEQKYSKSEFERHHYALLALMCVYGIELLADNITECRANLLEVMASHLSLPQGHNTLLAASVVIRANIVHGDAKLMTNACGAPILFAEWGYLGKGKYQRRDFRLKNLTLAADYNRCTTTKDTGSLYTDLKGDELFLPATTYPRMTIRDLARQEHSLKEAGL